MHGSAGLQGALQLETRWCTHMYVNIEGQRHACVSQTVWFVYFLFPVAGCRIHDPQVSGWLLDPANPSTCYQDLLTKHLGMPQAPPAVGAKKVGWDSSSQNLTKGSLLLADTQLNVHLTDCVTFLISQGSLPSKTDLFIPSSFSLCPFRCPS